MVNAEQLKSPNYVFDEYAETRLQECIDFVNNQRPELEEDLIKVFNMEHWKRADSRVHIHSDFAPLSFYFVKMFCHPDTKEWLRDYNGGIIFHGKHDGHGSGAGPSFSVTLDKADGWRIHT